MERNGNMCEKLEICVFSGDELTEELKEHAKECDRCRKFLEQNEKLCEDLKQLDITGLQDGKIASAVMEKIRGERRRTGVSFNFTHHLGTAAALVIVCALALYMKNAPVSVSDNTVKLSEKEMSVEDGQKELNDESAPILYDTRFMAADEEAYTEDTATSYSDEAEFENHELDEVPAAFSINASIDTADAGSTVPNGEPVVEENGTSDSKKVLMKSAPKTHEAEAYSLDTDAVEAVTEETADDLRKYVASEPEETQNYTASQQAPASGILTEENTSYDFDDAAVTESESVFDADTSYKTSTPSGSFGGGGGGGASAAPRADAEDAKEAAEEQTAVEEAFDGNAVEDKYSESFLVFGSLEFLQGEENLDFNVSVANERLMELYGEGFCKIDRKYLVHNGWGGNAFFFETAPYMTYSFLCSLEGSSRTLTGK